MQIDYRLVSAEKEYSNARVKAQTMYDEAKIKGYTIGLVEHLRGQTDCAGEMSFGFVAFKETDEGNYLYNPTWSVQWGSIATDGIDKEIYQNEVKLKYERLKGLPVEYTTSDILVMKGLIGELEENLKFAEAEIDNEKERANRAEAQVSQLQFVVQALNDHKEPYKAPLNDSPLVKCDSDIKETIDDNKDTNKEIPLTLPEGFSVEDTEQEICELERLLQFNKLQMEHEWANKNKYIQDTIKRHKDEIALFQETMKKVEKINQDNIDRKTTSSKNRYIYHYSADLIGENGKITRYDGILCLEEKIKTHERYRQIKMLIDENNSERKMLIGEDNSANMTITSLSYLYREQGDN